eukprot:SM000245S08174  [mRNA]  locus=s245:26566:32992:+ [translate_table: standard]
MPTIGVGRDNLFRALGRTYTEDEFDELCFEFGIELDDVTTEKAIIRKEKHLDDEEADADEEVIYKIEVPANRYDLLCLEGLARALRIFLSTESTPEFRLAAGPPPLQMTVLPETALIRPFIVCAALRGVSFDQTSYDSFIELQDRLHQNICRRRTLVSIGTHDLAKVQEPFTYEQALPPMDINFVPLKQTRSFNGMELMEFYKSDNKLKKFLHIIADSPVFPVVLDKNRHGGWLDLDIVEAVLSLPPIINGALSAMSASTRDVLLEVTALDLTKANIVLNTMASGALPADHASSRFSSMELHAEGCGRTIARLGSGFGESGGCLSLTWGNVADVIADGLSQPVRHSPEGHCLTLALHFLQVTMFAQLCKRPFEVEPVVVVEADGTSTSTPNLSMKFIEVDNAYINGHIGIKQRASEAASLLTRMQLPSTAIDEGGVDGFGGRLRVSVPPTRSDVLHACDVMEVPSAYCCSGRLGDNENLNASLWLQVAQAGFTEVLTFSLISLAENFQMMNRPNDGATAVKISNPRSSEFEVVRSSLLPGMLKTLSHNKEAPRPVKLFEVSDVARLDPSKDVGACNLRHMVASFCGLTSGFEVIHGLVDRVMEVAGVGPLSEELPQGYYIKASQQGEFFPGRQADIICRGQKIGTFGVIHPEILEKFDILDPCTAMELDVSELLQV